MLRLQVVLPAGRSADCPDLLHGQNIFRILSQENIFWILSQEEGTCTCCTQKYKCFFFTVKQTLLLGLVNLELQYKELERRRKGRNVHENMKVLEIKMFKEITC